MEHEQAKPNDNLSASLVARHAIAELLSPRGRFRMECRDKDGNLKWFEEWDNVITTQGKDDWLDKYFEGSTYTAAWYVGLIDAAGFTAVAAGDTAAQINGSNGWAELSEYDEATRPALAFAAASGGTKATSAASAFTINATKTVKGAFVVSTNTKDGTTGVLFSAKAFSADRNVAASDTLNVSYSASLT